MPLPVAARIPSGFPGLDALLGGGWPTGLLTEVLVPDAGTLELGLLCPALARVTGADPAPAVPRRVMLIAPPWIPYAPGLGWQGLPPERVLTVRVRQPPEALWAMEETLRSGVCAAVIAWVTTTAAQRAGRFLLQRLHLLAGRQQAWAVLIRTTRFRRQRSSARLRLEVQATTPGRLQVEIFRNGWRGTGAVTVERRF